ncbi:Lrp/AsnC family transcriptional regulator [Brevibacillus fulvus]|uniref:Lrp/AsnC family transcriptional regulator for asnA, asnC and gidA n=1 Tax=Brevibacillus fulvus TaxID=1125967 RepID=A0A938XZ87_9BACL|nr:Lrp/AsnC family transcriptional regulator [Brevibacillus fulvus]MBM7590338.1 Lrp/AsnC family transcriptional regulator for asnA, asnC and gidA [Brevibacillus fulvus]
MDDSFQRSLYSELDDLDYQIVCFLEENARTPFTQIAKELGVTEKTVRMRVQQMQEEGVLSLIGVVNPVKAGIRVETIIQLAVSGNYLDAVINTLQETPEVRLVILTSGEYQLLIQVFTRDNQEFSEFFMNKLNKIEGIIKSNVIMELKVLKSKFKFIR